MSPGPSSGCRDCSSGKPGTRWGAGAAGGTSRLQKNTRGRTRGPLATTATGATHRTAISLHARPAPFASAPGSLPQTCQPIGHCRQRRAQARGLPAPGVGGGPGGPPACGRARRGAPGGPPGSHVRGVGRPARDPRVEPHSAIAHAPHVDPESRGHLRQAAVPVLALHGKSGEDGQSFQIGESCQVSGKPIGASGMSGYRARRASSRAFQAVLGATCFKR